MLHGGSGLVKTRRWGIEPAFARRLAVTVFRPPEHLYPFPSRWLDLGGIRLHYLDEGPREAPAVLMLHGNPTWSFYYRDLVLALRGRFRCIVPDHVGCGLSDKPGDAEYPYRLERRVADLDELMRHLALAGPLHLVVHDWGGMIGFAWAAARPQAIASLVILNTAAFPMPASKRLPPALWFAGRTRPGALLVRGCNAFAAAAARVALRQPVAREVRKCYTGPYDSWANRIATLRFVQDIPLVPADRGYQLLASTESSLRQFRDTPALLAWGGRDFVFDRTFLDRWRELLPRARVLEYPDCGHYVLEDAGEPLLREITNFLSTEGTRTVG